MTSTGFASVLVEHSLLGSYRDAGAALAVLGMCQQSLNYTEPLLQTEASS